jgi:trimeric autotransporter adhesin
MSTKTLRKRIALVAVASMGFGLMSTVPASAADISNISTAELGIKSTPSDASLVSVQTGSFGEVARQSSVTIYTDRAQVLTSDLALTITTTDSTDQLIDTYGLTLSPDLITGIGNIPGTNGAGVVTSTSVSGLTRTLPADFPDKGGTYATFTNDANANSTADDSALLVGVHYLYVTLAANATARAATSWVIRVTVANPTDSAITATLPSASTIAGRVNNLVSVPVSVTTAAFVGSTGLRPQLRVAAAISSQPTSSSVQPVLTAGSATLASVLTRFDATKSISAGSTLAVSASVARTSTADSVAPASIAYTTTGASGVAVAVQSTAFDVATLSFTPTHVGTYRVTVWNELSTTGAAALSGSESYQTFTINVSAGVSTIALTPVNATSVEDADHGSLVKVEIKDAAGNAAALAAGEVISIDPTGTGTVAYASVGTGSATFAGGNTATSAAAGAAWSLAASNFVGGVAFVNITNATAETSVLVASLSSNSSVTASTSLLFRSKTTTAITLEPSALASGWAGSADAYTTPLVSSITYSTAGGVAVGSTSTLYGGFTVEDDTGVLSGLKFGRYDVAVSEVVGSTVTIGGTFEATGAVYTMSDVANVSGLTATAFGVSPNVITAAAIDPSVTANALVTDTVAFNISSLRIAPAGTASFILTISDQFARALPNATVTLTWSGRNTSTAATQKVGLTDANGQITLSYTDTALATATATADTVTATAVFGAASSTSTATVTWVATTVGTVTLTSTGDTDTIAGTTKTDISAAAAGATGTSATASALVKDANGVIIVGAPVTFAVTGLVGAELHTTMATVYTDSTGTALARISSYAAGKATVTATAGTVTATDDVYFSQQTLTEARTIAATVSGNNVVATVKDRYGNTIEGVTVNATRVGTGFFGTGASTATGVTDANGVIEFQYNGAGTITVAFSTTTYGQSSSAAAKVGTTAVTAAAAGTASANQTGLGASLAPAGVNSVAVTVAAQENAAENAATAAADAAAEATDAANAATDAANAAAEAADAATAAAQDAADAVAALSASVAEMMSALRKQITSLTNIIVKIQKKVRA